MREKAEIWVGTCNRASKHKELLAELTKTFSYTCCVPVEEKFKEKNVVGGNF